jgi:hypothetical protein
VLAGSPALVEAAVGWRVVDRGIVARQWGLPALDPPDVAVNLHGRGPQSIALLASTRPRRLVTCAPASRSSATVRAVAWDRPDGPGGRVPEHRADRWLRLVEEAFGYGGDRSDHRLGADGPPPAGLQGTVVLHPGASTGARRWPVERFADVGRALVAAGAEVVVTAGPGESLLARSVAAATGTGARTWSPPSVLELSLGLASAAGVVVGDTGVGHLAVAVGTPGVHLYGPLAPTEWGPVHDDGRRVVLHRVVPGDPTETDAADPHPALLRVSPVDVLAALDTLGVGPGTGPSGRAAVRLGRRLIAPPGRAARSSSPA